MVYLITEKSLELGPVLYGNMMPDPIYGIVIYLVSVLVFFKIYIYQERISQKQSVVLSVLALLGVYIFVTAFVDEVHIGLEQSYNLFHHGKFSFSPESIVDGATDCLMLLLLTPFAWSQQSLYAATYIFGFVVACLHLFVVAEILRDVDRKYRLFLLILFASYLPFVKVVGSGFGSSLLTLGLFVGYLLLQKEQFKKAALVAVVLPFIRPDGIFFALSIVVVIGLLERRIIVQHYILPLVSLGVYLFLFNLYYGHWIPTPMAYKSFPLEMETIKTLIFLKSSSLLFILTKLALYTVVPMTFFLLQRRGDTLKRIGILLPLAGVTTYYVIFSHGLHWETRYTIFTSTLIWVLWLTTLGILNGDVKGIFKGEIISKYLSIVSKWTGKPLPMAIMLTGFLFIQSSGISNAFEHRKNEKGTVNAYGLSGQLLDTLLPKDWAIATTEINTVGYAIDRPIIDLAGYTNREIATSDQYNHHLNKISPSYFLRENPVVFWELTFHESFEAVGPSLENYQQELGHRKNVYMYLEEWLTWGLLSRDEYYIGDIREVVNEYDVVLLGYKEWTLVLFIDKDYTNEFFRITTAKGFSIDDQKMLNHRKLDKIYSEQSSPKHL